MSVPDVLMSSPARPVQFDSYIDDSSSPLPPLSELFRKPAKKSPLRSGSNAAPIPTLANTTFASAESLLREIPELDIDVEPVSEIPTRKLKPTRKRAVKSQPAVQKSTTAKGKAPPEGESSRKNKPGRKSRSKNTIAEDNQPELPKGRDTKRSTADKGKKTETDSRHFSGGQQEAKQPASKNQGGLPVDNTGHHPAIARRGDWTPPPANRVMQNPDSDDQELLSSVDKAAASKVVFQNLYGDYALRKEEVSQNQRHPPVQPSEKTADVLKKRKRLELISTSDEKPPTEKSPTKAPPVRKKTRTITELATAPYAPVDEVELLAPGNKDSLLNYFDSDGAVKAMVEHQTIRMETANAKAKKVPAKPRKNRKSGTLDNPILLSPNSALKQSDNQDFLFGTSSQLVREDSPTMLRDLQLAMQASNCVEDDPFASSSPAPAKGRKGLWQAGARDTDGELLAAEVVNLVDVSTTPILQGTATISTGKDNTKDDFIDIRELCPSSPNPTSSESTQPRSHFFQTQTLPSSNTTAPSSLDSVLPITSEKAPTPRPKYELFTDSQLSTKIASYGFKPVKKREAMIALLDQCWTSTHPGTTSSVTTTTGAAFSTSASVSLPKQASPKKKQPAPTSAPAEPIKKARGRPKKAVPAVTASSASTAPVNPSTESPTKKGVGRPKKAAKNTSAAMEDPNAASETLAVTPNRRKKASRKAIEIADSDEEDLLSSTHSSPEHVFSSPPAIDMSILEDADMPLNLSPTDQQAMLFSHITRAVKSAPRSADPANPSWHEKMLLYDPVILEDLAAWLNLGQLTRVGYDGEVSPEEVKKWCESKSVLCLWRVGLRGQERKRV